MGLSQHIMFLFALFLLFLSSVRSLEVPWQRPSLSRRQLAYLCLRKTWTLTFLVRCRKPVCPTKCAANSTGSFDCRWKSDSYASSAYEGVEVATVDVVVLNNQNTALQQQQSQMNFLMRSKCSVDTVDQTF